MSSLAQDVRYGIRMLAKTPAFTAVAVLTLALGIGANASIFSLIDALLVENLPVADPSSLLLMGEGRNWGFTSGMPESYQLFSYPLYKYFRAQDSTFSATLAVQSTQTDLSVFAPGAASAQVSHGKVVSGNYFDVLGVKPFAGRLFSDRDDTPEAAQPLVVLSHRFWELHLGADPAIVGKSIRVNAIPYTVIGIAPPEFFGEIVESDPADMWFPIAMQPQLMQSRSLLASDDVNWLQIIGRLHPGMSVAQAQSQTTALLRGYLPSALGSLNVPRLAKMIQRARVDLTPCAGGISHLRTRYSAPLHLLMGMVGLILLLACINIANLLLARAAVRNREMSLRVALGASRARMIRQLLTESLLLAVAGGSLGLLLARWMSSALVSLAFGNDRYFPVNAILSPRVLGFSAAVCIATGILFGLVPAFRASRANLNGVLRGNMLGSGVARRSMFSLGNVLVASQIALSLILMVSAGLLLRSLSRLETQDFGFQHEHVLIASLNPHLAGFKPEQLPAVYDQIISRIKSLPGVQDASLSLYSPLDGNQWSSNFVADPLSPGASPRQDNAWWLRVTPDYFQTLGVQLKEGRTLTDADGPGSEKVVVVNEAFARKFFNGGSPLGRRVGWVGTPSQMQIVGMIRDAKAEDAHIESQPMVFFPMFQRSGNLSLFETARVQSESMYATALEVRVVGDPLSIANALQLELSHAVPDLPVIRIRSFDQQIARSLTQERLITNLAAGFGALALVIASIGVYGLMAYSVGRRTREIGVRMAIGAARRGILRMILREGATLAAIGIAIGVAGSFGAAKLVASQLYGTSPNDAATFVVAGAVLAIVAMAACFIPALRATRVDPLIALRDE
ncbi:MAG TPA: ABC transporter permease [Candidatus Acidoferrales bacterium]|nr:ABC transporter permease [Candidatus Acidoferrales bacterium]